MGQEKSSKRQTNYCKESMGLNIFKFRGTPGIGDSMFAMNVAHNYAYQNKTQVELHFYWPHDEDYYFHFEDPETIVERTNYIHQFYYRSNDVIIKHFYNMNNEHVNKYRMTLNDVCCIHNEDGTWFDEDTYPEWLFDERYIKKEKEYKVVIWRSLFNANEPRWWKRLTNDKVIPLLKQQDLDVIELDYRTPISEVFYHISECDFVVGYDGMWHYIARNFLKPMLIISSERFTKYHNPHAWQVSNGEEHNYMDFIRDLFNLHFIHSKKYKDYFDTHTTMTTNYELLHSFNEYYKNNFFQRVLSD